MARRDKQINVRVTEETKRQWERFEQQSNMVDGMADLIRRSVNATVNQGGAPLVGDVAAASSADGESSSTEVLNRITRIEDELDDIARTVERVDESAGFIERELVQSNDDESFTDKVLRAVPPAKPLSDDWERKKERRKGSDNPVGDIVAWDGTVEAFAETFDRDVAVMEPILKKIRAQYSPPVNVESVDGEVRYWSDRQLELNPYADGRTTAERMEQEAFEHRQESRDGGWR